MGAECLARSVESVSLSRPGLPWRIATVAAHRCRRPRVRDRPSFRSAGGGTRIPPIYHDADCRTAVGKKKPPGAVAPGGKLMTRSASGCAGGSDTLQAGRRPVDRLPRPSIGRPVRPRPVSARGGWQPAARPGRSHRPLRHDSRVAFRASRDSVAQVRITNIRIA